MNKEKKLETIDKSEVQMPGFDWLSADYTMQTRCQEPLVKALPPGGVVCRDGKGAVAAVKGM